MPTPSFKLVILTTVLDQTRETVSSLYYLKGPEEIAVLMIREIKVICIRAGKRT